MPRSYTQTSTARAGDRDWRGLTRDAQWLYDTLLNGPLISLAGVQDWRPAKLAARCKGTTADEVRAFAKELVEKRFILIDHDTEEVLVRTFARHDGVLRGPKTAIGLRNALADVGSETLRDAVSVEVFRESQRTPDLAGLRELGDVIDRGRECLPNIPSAPHAEGIRDVPDTLSTKYLAGIHVVPDTSPDGVSEGVSDEVCDSHPLLDPRTYNHVGAADADPPPATSKPKKATATSRKKQIPKDWSLTAADRRYAEDRNVDADRQAEQFRNHHIAKGSTMIDWSAAWRTWVGKAVDFGNTRPAPARSSWGNVVTAADLAFRDDA